MSSVVTYPMTRQGVRDLDNPIRQPMRSTNVSSAERTASTVGAAALVGCGLLKGGLTGLLLIAAGGALAYRGLTGHCPAYTAAGINTARRSV